VKDRLVKILGTLAEAIAFSKWAWGEGYEELDGNELVWAWNKRHYKKLRISVGGEIDEDIPKMIELWRHK
jgi:hypothetical protein